MSQIQSSVAQEGMAGGVRQVRELYLAKGLARIFWGLLTVLILFGGHAVVEIFHFMKMPAYVTGSALAVWGAGMLIKAGAISVHWHWRSRAVLVLFLLQIYFAPFFVWWRSELHQIVFAVNVLALLLSTVLLLFLLNLLVADIFRLFALRANEMEARLYAGVVVAVMLMPLSWAVFLALRRTFPYQYNLCDEVLWMIKNLPLWGYVLASLPCSLTLLSLWKAKTCCYRLIAERG